MTEFDLGLASPRLCRPSGQRLPIQIRKTVEAKDPRPGAGRRLAERELAAMVAKVSSGNVSTGSETVEEPLNAWLDHIGPNRSPTTLRKYRDLADRIVIPELGKVRLKALTARQLDRLYGKLTAKGNKATSVRRVHALIAAALHQAERWALSTKPGRKATPPPIRPQPVQDPPPTRSGPSWPRPRSSSQAWPPCCCWVPSPGPAGRAVRPPVDRPRRRRAHPDHRPLGL